MHLQGETTVCSGTPSISAHVLHVVPLDSLASMIYFQNVAYNIDDVCFSKDCKNNTSKCTEHNM